MGVKILPSLRRDFVCQINITMEDIWKESEETRRTKTKVMADVKYEVCVQTDFLFKNLEAVCVVFCYENCLVSGFCCYRFWREQNYRQWRWFLVACNHVKNLCRGHMSYWDRHGKLSDVGSDSGNGVCIASVYCFTHFYVKMSFLSSWKSEMIFEYKGFVKTSKTPTQWKVLWKMFVMAKPRGSPDCFCSGIVCRSVRRYFCFDCWSSCLKGKC